jgi:hypothetical protein
LSVWQRHKSSLLKPGDHAFNVINPPVPAAPRQLQELSGPPVMIEPLPVLSAIQRY